MYNYDEREIAYTDRLFRETRRSVIYILHNCVLLSILPTIERDE